MGCTVGRWCRLHAPSIRRCCCMPCDGFGSARGDVGWAGDQGRPFDIVFSCGAACCAAARGMRAAGGGCRRTGSSCKVGREPRHRAQGGAHQRGTRRGRTPPAPGCTYAYIGTIYIFHHCMYVSEPALCTRGRRACAMDPSRRTNGVVTHASAATVHNNSKDRGAAQRGGGGWQHSRGAGVEASSPGAVCGMSCALHGSEA